MMSLLDVSGLSHSFNEGNIFKNAALSLNKGEHLGIVGPNGSGKSTLINICTGKIIPDKGNVSWHPRTTVGCLDQHALIEKDITVKDFLQSAFDPFYVLEEKMNALYAKAGDGDPKVLDQAAQYQEELEAKGFYTIETRIQQVAAGLGLLAIGLERPVTQMSGGQRAKVILAKLLLVKPDVMLLDEPTNFLDKEHILWLGDYLSTAENAFMVVSHDFSFLEKIATHIADIDNASIKKYRGCYSEFLKKKTILRENYIKQYCAQQKEIKRTEEFIRKNIAGRKTKMAQGRRSQLERMDRLEAIEAAQDRPQFSFKALPAAATEFLSVKRLWVGYYYPILSDLDFSVRGGQKIVFTGFNGIGKSTLLKTLVGEIPALQGSFVFAPQIKLAYYEQDFVWENDMQTPVQIISAAYPRLSVKEVRQQLFRCGIPAKHALQEIKTLSGGEQAKVKMCLLTLKPCNFLIMDEPTNHLDRQAKESLKAALIKFPGAILLVSHEEAFYRGWAQRIINIENSKG